MTRRARHGERGAATAELAVVMPMLVALTIGLVWLLAVGSAQVRTVDAARETARAVARGDADAAAMAHGRQVAPSGSRITVVSSGQDVTVTVRATVAGPGGLFAGFPAARVRATAVAATEETS
ncbi:MAG: pilus assembly protein [Nocardioides sp.]|nr:pilus assembly protein [Nocardioides sp.]